MNGMLIFLSFFAPHWCRNKSSKQLGFVASDTALQLSPYCYLENDTVKSKGGKEMGPNMKCQHSSQSTCNAYRASNDTVKTKAFPYAAELLSASVDG